MSRPLVRRAIALLAGCTPLLLASAPAVGAARVAPTTAVAVGPYSSVGGPLMSGTGVVADPAAGETAPPGVDLSSYVVADADTGQILAAKAPHMRLYPASTQKMLMALVVLPLLNPGARYVANAHDMAPEPDGSAVGIQPGTSYTVADLWHGVFLRSGNDAVEMLANLAGGVPHVVSLMRAEAKKLQANDTTVVDADGYDQPGQLSSAYDLALMGRAGLRDPLFRSYCAMSSARFPGRGNSTFAIDTENRLMGVYPGIIGIKNGYTSLAGHTYVGAATRDGHTLIVSVMHGGLDIYQQTAKLLDWGFAADGHARPVGTLVSPLVPRPAHPGPSHAAAPATSHASHTSTLTSLLLWLVLAVVVVAALGTGGLVWRRRRRAGAPEADARDSRSDASGPDDEAAGDDDDESERRVRS